VADDSVDYFFAKVHFTDRYSRICRMLWHRTVSEMYELMQKKAKQSKVTALFMTLSTLHFTSFDQRHILRPGTPTSFHLTQTELFSGILITNLHNVIFHVSLVPLTHFFVRGLNSAYRCITFRGICREPNPREWRSRSAFTIVTEVFKVF
jgi:hypothetical protein